MTGPEVGLCQETWATRTSCVGLAHSTSTSQGFTYWYYKPVLQNISCFCSSLFYIFFFYLSQQFGTLRGHKSMLMTFLWRIKIQPCVNITICVHITNWTRFYNLLIVSVSTVTQILSSTTNNEHVILNLVRRSSTGCLKSKYAIKVVIRFL